MERLQPRERTIVLLLTELREHLGRMHDMSVESVIPDRVLQIIALTPQISSVMEISTIFEEAGVRAGI